MKNNESVGSIFKSFFIIFICFMFWPFMLIHYLFFKKKDKKVLTYEERLKENLEFVKNDKNNSKGNTRIYEPYYKSNGNYDPGSPFM